MKLKFTKAISLLLAIMIFLPSINACFSNMQISAYAVLTQEDEEDFIDAQTELQYALCSRAGDWWTATKVDGCAYNFFHNEVQRYLTNTLFKNTLKKELRIDYNQPVKTRLLINILYMAVQTFICKLLIQQSIKQQHTFGKSNLPHI